MRAFARCRLDPPVAAPGRCYAGCDHTATNRMSPARISPIPGSAAPVLDPSGIVGSFAPAAPPAPPAPIAHRPGTRRWLRDPRLAAYAAVALGVLVRTAHVLSAGFPLNDGGLFLRMTEEIQAAQYHLPAFTSYNNGGIPFAYSPLALYVAAVLNGVFGIPLLQLFRFIPLVATALTVVAFYRLARAMLRDELTAAAAVLAFGIFPRSFVWLLMGGGVTRAPGLLFAIIGLHQAFEMYTRREWRYAVTTTIACALTVLTHLSTANFLAFSIVLLFLFYGRHRFGIVSSLAVGAATILITSPWWAAVIAQHGTAPFAAASTSSPSMFTDRLSRYDVLLRLARFNTTIGGEPLFPLISVLAVVGALASLRPGLLVFPIWWVVIVVLDARGGMTYAPVPAAMLAGIGITRALVPGLRALYSAPERVRTQIIGSAGAPASVAGTPPSRTAMLLRYVPAVVLAFLLVYGVAEAVTRNPDYGGETFALEALTPADRAAMRWAGEHIPPGSRFLVVSGRNWARDKVSEWFPAIANRTSVSTVQGSEWLAGFVARRETNDKYQKRCAKSDGNCLEAWAGAMGQSFTHVYVQKSGDEPCCARLIAALRQDARFVTMYDGPAAFIAARR